MLDTMLSNFKLERIFIIIKRKLFFIIIIGLLGGMATGYFGLMTSYELYSAKVSMYVYGNQNYIYDPTINVSSSDFSKAKSLVPSYMLVLKSNTVLSKVLEKVDLPYQIDELADMISSQSVQNTAIFNIYVTHPDPYVSMELVNAIAEIAPEEIARVVKSGGVEVVDYATLPLVPFTQTSIIKHVLIGSIGFGGMLTMIFLFFGLLDTTIRKKHELNDAFNIPLLGDIPNIKDPSRKIHISKILSVDSPFALKESYNSIRANIMFTKKAEECPVFVISSATKGEGKTLNCINIAISFSMMGKKTLLIDADLRSPSLTRRLDLEEHTTGLSYFLAGITDNIDIVKSEYNNLDVISVGEVPPNPSELLNSSRLYEFIREAKKDYDYILIDTAPIGIVSDALALSEYITGYILVVKSNVSKLSEQKSIVRTLESCSAEISGILYNGVNPKSSDYAYKNYNDIYE